MFLPSVSAHLFKNMNGLKIELANHLLMKIKFQSLNRLTICRYITSACLTKLNIHTRTIRHLCVISTLIFSINSSASVTLERYKNTNEVTITIDHQIIEEDLIEFKNALGKIETEKKVLHMNSIQLNSRGGSSAVGRQIGSLIRSKGLYTYVAPKSKCASACVFILMSGVVRYAFGEIGVHRATFTKDNAVEDDK